MSDGRISNGGNRDQRIEKIIRVVADAPQQKRKRNLGELKMKRLITICTVVVIMCALPNVAQAVLWEIQDAGLLDTANFVNTSSGTNGNLNSRIDIPGDPGTQFNITLTNDLSVWTDITIGDSFDLPFNNAGFSLNVIPIGAGGMGDLSSPYTGYTMSIQNPGPDAFVAALYMNTGWTDNNIELDRYYQDTAGGTSIVPGGTATLTLNFSSAAWWNGTAMVPGTTVLNYNHVSNIGFKIGANLGSNQGEVISGTPFNVNVVPEPATIALLGLGALSLIRARRKTRA